MAKAKAREVLSVRRESADHCWFHLWVAGTPDLHVDDRKCTWEIDVRADTTEAHVRREYDRPRGEPNRRLQVKKVKIVGPRNEIENLLYNLGEGLPGQKVGPRWGEQEEDLS